MTPRGGAGGARVLRRVLSGGFAVAYPLVALVLIWYLAVVILQPNQFALPAPGDTFVRARELWEQGTLWAETFVTMRRVGVSFLVALMVGIPLGIVLGRVAVVSAMFMPVTSFLFTTPKTAFFPAMMIVLGLGSASKIALGFSLAVFQILIGVAAAASQIEEKLVWSSRSLGASSFGTFSRVVLPATLPGTVSACRVGMVGAIVGVFLGELLAGTDGLGQLMIRSRSTFDAEGVYVCVVVVCLVAYLLDTMVRKAGHAVTSWAEVSRGS